MKKSLLLVSSIILMTTSAAYAHESSTPHSEHNAMRQENRAIAQATQVQAQQRLDQKRAELEQKKIDLRAKAAANKDEACQRRLDKLENRIANSDNRKKGLLTHYSKAAEHLQRLIDRSSAAGVDVTELTADLAEYKTKVGGLATDFNTFTTLVAQAQTVDCEQPKEQLRALHEQIKTAHQKVVSDRKAIHDYYKGTIRPDVVTAIKAIAATKKAEKPGEQSNPGGEL